MNRWYVYICISLGILIAIISFDCRTSDTLIAPSKWWTLPRFNTSLVTSTAQSAATNLKSTLWSSLQANRLPRTEDEAIQREFIPSSAPVSTLDASRRAALVSAITQHINTRAPSQTPNEQNSPTQSWHTRLSSWSTRLHDAATGTASAVKKQLQRTDINPIAHLKQQKETYEKAQELQLKQVRTQWHTENKQPDWKSWLPHWERTSQQQKRFDSGKKLLDQYDQIAKHRVLTDPEIKEINTVTKDMLALANTTEEQEHIVLTKQAVLNQDVSTLRGKTTAFKGLFQKEKEKAQDKTLDLIVKTAVEQGNLVTYIENQIIAQLPTKIPQWYRKQIADTLIQEAGNISDDEPTGNRLLRGALSKYSEDLQEQVVERVRKYIQEELPQEIEKIPILANKLKEATLPHAPGLSKRLIKEIAEQLKYQEDPYRKIDKLQKIKDEWASVE